MMKLSEISIWPQAALKARPKVSLCEHTSQWLRVHARVGFQDSQKEVMMQCFHTALLDY